MADDKTIKNAFISHIHKDDSRLASLKSLVEKAGYAIRDYSITKEKPNNANNENHIKYNILKPQIERAGTLIVLISPKTKDSAYVNWEIECANRLGKRIVGVWDNGAKGCDVPDALDKYADAVVGWRSGRVVDAIEGKVNNWEMPNGSPRPARNITRYGC